MVHTGFLNASSSYTKKYHFQIPSSWNSGTYTVEVSADTFGSVFEFTQVNNNVIKEEFKLHQVLPDLIIDSCNMEVTGNKESGKIEIQVDVSMKNIGDIDVSHQLCIML